MSGLEAAILAGASKGLASALLSEKVYDFFSTWKLDTSLLDKMEVQLNSVEALLTDAEDKLIEENTRVENWTQKARFAIYDAEDFLEKILADVPGSNKVRTNTIDIVESSNSFSDKVNYKLNNIARAIHPSKKTIEEELVQIIERLQFIAHQKDALGLKEKNELSLYRKERLSSSIADGTSTIYGRSNDKDTIIRLINSRKGNDDALRVISIVGMGGIGKTTLACMVFHEYKSLNRSFGLPSWIGRFLQRQDHNSNPTVFDVKGWACVSDEFDESRVIKSLLESITGQQSKVDNSKELLKQELLRKLQDKKFLVVLDDLWSPTTWDVLRTLFSVGALGSRVIVTTRSDSVAKVVTTSIDLSHKLDKLSADDSWSLFEKIVFRDEKSSAHPELIKVGKKIVSRCDGLPLAIKMIGGLLLSKGNGINEWESVLSNKIWKNTKIIPSLLLSYYDLPLGVRDCFVYCSIFPKNYSFSMEKVITLWVGEGLIEKFCEDSKYEDVARAYFTDLRSKFFFQESSYTGGTSEFDLAKLFPRESTGVPRTMLSKKFFPKFVMHDLVHDLALRMSRGLCVDICNVTIQSRRLLYILGKDKYLLNNTSTTKLHHLRTFLSLQVNFVGFGMGFYSDKKLLSEMLSNFKLLRVLSLKGHHISTFPKSVGDMKLLRYLDLSCTHIDELPNKICRLYNLQILLLSNCRKLKSLPENLFNLVNLRHLHIDGTRLEKMPDGIGKTKNIRTLSNFVLGRGKSKQMREFKELQNLHGVVHISRLNNVEDTKDVINAGFKNKEYLEGLVLEWEATRAMGTEVDDEKVLDAIEAHKKLRTLIIRGYGGKRLSDWIVRVSPSFTDLVSLSIVDCFNCEALPSLGNLPFLKHLEMRSLDSLESFGRRIYGDSHCPFQALEKLTIVGMKALKTWCFPCGDRVGFQMLDILQIWKCCELTKIKYCFPSLTWLDINSCDNLVKSEITTCRHTFEFIRISSCPKLEEIPNTFANSFILRMERCEKLGFLPRFQDCRDEVIEDLMIQCSMSNLFRAEINLFSSLKRLDLNIPVGLDDEDCEAIRLPPNLSDFTIGGGTFHVNTKILTELSNLKSLTKLHVDKYSLELFPDAELPPTLKYLTVNDCSALKIIPDRFLSGCSKSLLELRIDNCGSLECLPSSLSTLESLRTLCIGVCDSIHELPSISSSGPNYLTNLSFFMISDCGALECLPVGLHKATALHIYNCPNLCVTENGFPVDLRSLHISDCDKMKPFVKTVLPTLTSLTRLKLSGFEDIRSLDHRLPESIQTLTIWDFPRLKSLTGVLPNLKNLNWLSVAACPLVDPKSWS